MTNGDKILQFSASRTETFGRGDLLSWIASQYPETSLGSIDVTLRRMTKQGILVRTAKGEYKISEGSKPNFSIKPDEEMISLYQAIRNLYPYTNLCIWNANVISSLMHHVPSLDIILLETERIAMEPVFNDLSRLTTRRALLKPTERDYSLYASGNSCVIVKPLISEAPLVNVEKIATPGIEKILVDISTDPEFPYARESELYTIYENAWERFSIDKKCMLRYASRRGKREETNKLINSTMF